MWCTGTKSFRSESHFRHHRVPLGDIRRQTPDGRAIINKLAGLRPVINIARWTQGKLEHRQASHQSTWQSIDSLSMPSGLSVNATHRLVPPRPAYRLSTRDVAPFYYRLPGWSVRRVYGVLIVPHRPYDNLNLHSDLHLLKTSGLGRIDERLSEFSEKKTGYQWKRNTMSEWMSEQSY